MLQLRYPWDTISPQIPQNVTDEFSNPPGIPVDGNFEGFHIVRTNHHLIECPYLHQQS